MEETETFRPAHYHSQPFNSSEVQETIFEQMTREAAGKRSDRILLRAMWVSFAVKHLLRAGLKDDVDIELRKAENYLHKARTGEWLNDG